VNEELFSTEPFLLLACLLLRSFTVFKVN